MSKSNGCKIRNELNELSHIESLIYKKYFCCLKKTLKQNKDNTNHIERNNDCKSKLDIELDHIKSEVNNLMSKHSICLSKCTDYLNSPSEELTCYDLCEQNYYNKLSLIGKFENM